MKYFGCRMCIYFVFISHCTCRYSVCPVEQLIIEHVISMASASKSSTKPKLLSIQEKLDIMNKVDATANGTKNYWQTWHYCVNFKCGHVRLIHKTPVWKWTAELNKDENSKIWKNGSGACGMVWAECPLHLCLCL